MVPLAAEPPQSLVADNLMRERCCFCAVPVMEQVLDTAHGEEVRGMGM